MMTPNSASVIEHQRNEVKNKYKVTIAWNKVFMLLYLHLSALYGIYLAFTSVMLKTKIFTVIYGYIGGLGITAGSHRLWSHRSYKATWPLRILLCILTSIAAQGNIYEWCRNHRVHHKFAETDADPYNIKRGFFFAHMGWLMCKKHPDVKNKGKSVDVDDLLADPIVRFHKRFYIPMMLIFNFILPTMIPVWFWGETLWNSFFFAGMVKFCVSLHISFLVNSVAHYFGDRPINKHVEARENPIVALLAMGEGWHNYHHAFSWDYATSELGYTLNVTKMFIDLMAFLGLAYDLKSVPQELIENRKLKTGDGSRPKHMKIPENDLTAMDKTS